MSTVLRISPPKLLIFFSLRGNQEYVCDKGHSEIEGGYETGEGVLVQRIYYERHRQVWLITNDRAEKINAMDFDANDEITERLREFGAGAAARAAAISRKKTGVFKGCRGIRFYSPVRFIRLAPENR